MARGGDSGRKGQALCQSTFQAVKSQSQLIQLSYNLLLEPKGWNTDCLFEGTQQEWEFFLWSQKPQQLCNVDTC